jgi:hypothetical protein
MRLADVKVARAEFLPRSGHRQELLLFADAAQQGSIHRGTPSANHAKRPPLADQFGQFKHTSIHRILKEPDQNGPKAYSKERI